MVVFHVRVQYPGGYSVLQFLNESAVYYLELRKIHECFCSLALFLSFSCSLNHLFNSALPLPVYLSFINSAKAVNFAWFEWSNVIILNHTPLLTRSNLCLYLQLPLYSWL